MRIVAEIIAEFGVFWVFYALCSVIADAAIKNNTKSNANAHYISISIITILAFLQKGIRIYAGEKNILIGVDLIMDFVSPLLIMLIKPIQVRNRNKSKSKIEYEYYVICPKCKNQIFDNEEKCSNCGYERNTNNKDFGKIQSDKGTPLTKQEEVELITSLICNGKVPRVPSNEFKKMFGTHIGNILEERDVAIAGQISKLYIFGKNPSQQSVGAILYLVEIVNNIKHRYFALELSFGGSCVVTEWEFSNPNGDCIHKNYCKLIENSNDFYDLSKGNPSDRFIARIEEIIGNEPNIVIKNEEKMQLPKQPTIINYKGRYREYLIKLGYKEYTPSGNPSTVYQYLKSIESVMKNENFDDWKDVADNIDRLLIDYDDGGKNYKIDKSHRTIINALKRFEEFLRYNKN